MQPQIAFAPSFEECYEMVKESCSKQGGCTEPVFCRRWLMAKVGGPAGPAAHGQWKRVTPVFEAALVSGKPYYFAVWPWAIPDPTNPKFKAFKRVRQSAKTDKAGIGNLADNMKPSAGWQKWATETEGIEWYELRSDLEVGLATGGVVAERVEDAPVVENKKRKGRKAGWTRKKNAGKKPKAVASKAPDAVLPEPTEPLAPAVTGSDPNGFTSAAEIGQQTESTNLSRKDGTQQNESLESTADNDDNWTANLDTRTPQVARDIRVAFEILATAVLGYNTPVLNYCRGRNLAAGLPETLFDNVELPIARELSREMGVHVVQRREQILEKVLGEVLETEEISRMFDDDATRRSSRTRGNASVFERLPRKLAVHWIVLAYELMAIAYNNNRGDVLSGLDFSGSVWDVMYVQKVAQNMAIIGLYVPFEKKSMEEVLGLSLLTEEAFIDEEEVKSFAEFRLRLIA